MASLPLREQLATGDDSPLALEPGSVSLALEQGGVPLALEPGSVPSALRAAPQLSDVAAKLGSDSGAYLETLVELGAFDLTTARALEPHLDAMAILHQAGVDVAHLQQRLYGFVPAGDGAGAGSDEAPSREIQDAAWGVYAARATQLEATAASENGGASTGNAAGTASDEWVLNGIKPWCSLANVLPFALVTCGTPEGQRLFAVNLRHPGVAREQSPWVSRGLTDITSVGIVFDHVPAIAVGEPGFYLGRDGFAWGGIGVAAVWYGGAKALERYAFDVLRRREPDQVALAGLGELRVLSHGCATALRDAAARIDAGEASGVRGGQLGATIRALIAQQARRMLELTLSLVGPGPLTSDEEFARRVSDLTVYLSQHHGQRDLAGLGRQLLDAAGGPEQC